MLKNIAREVWAFDLEWVPDVASGRRVYGLPTEMPDTEVLHLMWAKGGATDDNPQPFLKTILCRVVSVAAVIRKQNSDGSVNLKLMALPDTQSDEGHKPLDEAVLLTRFLQGIGRVKPQLVGYNSHQSDIVIMVQRALAHGLWLPDFGERPNKPWEGVDYFAKGSDFNIDLKDSFAPFGKGTPSLHELASVSRIPGKLGTDGNDVINYWLEGRVREIVQYNECDALTTYLVWLRAANLAGLISPEHYLSEQQQLRELLTQRSTVTGNEHISEFIQAWDQLQKI